MAGPPRRARHARPEGPRHRARFLRPASPIVLAAVLALVLLVPGAAAHAALQSSVPTKGSRLATAPTFVSVTLTESVQSATLQVLDANDERVDLDDLTTTSGSNPTLRVSLPPDLPDGAYRMAWRATSVDTHTTHGIVGFAVGDFVPPDSQASSLDQVPWLAATGRFLAFLGLALTLGASLFLAWVPGAVAVPRRPTLEALLAGTALHLLGVVVVAKTTLDQTQLGLAGFAATSLGRTLLLRLGLGLGALAFAALAAWPRNPARLTPFVAIALVVVAGLASTRFNHAIAHAGLAGGIVDAIHLFAAAAWAGGLIVYLWVLGEAARAGWGPDEVRLAGIRFGTAALASVIALLSAGVGATLAILGGKALDPVGLVATSWGAVLAGKVVLTVGMLAIAIGNRYGILEPARERGFAARVQKAVSAVAPSLRSLEPRGGGLRRLVRIEALLGVAVFALAGILTSISPAAGTSPAGQPLSVTGFGADFHGELTADPAPVAGGTSTVTVHLETHDGVPIEGNTCGRAAPQSCVTAVFGDGEGGGETHALQPIGGGDWRVDGILWAQGGPTMVTVTVATAEVFGDEVMFHFTV